MSAARVAEPMPGGGVVNNYWHIDGVISADNLQRTRLEQYDVNQLQQCVGILNVPGASAEGRTGRNRG